MSGYVSVDVSEFQRPVDDSYPHRWFSFRVCDGSYRDGNAAENLAWAVKARAAGRLDGFSVYVVYRPGLNGTILANLDAFGVPHDCVVMIDAETWQGQISGDHSAELDALADALAQRQGSQSRVWGYANRSDFTSMWPTRPSWLRTVIASYGGSEPDFPNKVGWQYTDGQYTVSGLPSSSPPFGACDHNVFYPDALATASATARVLTEDELPQLTVPPKGRDQIAVVGAKKVALWAEDGGVGVRAIVRGSGPVRPLVTAGAAIDANDAFKFWLGAKQRFAVALRDGDWGVQVINNGDFPVRVWTEA